MDNFTNQLLNRVKTRFGIPSERQLAKKLGVGESRLRHWRRGTCSMDWNMAFEIADLLQETDQIVVHGLLDDKYENPRLVKALHAGRP
ncbi:transcriptional regulator [Vibrio tritonius]|uniref:helix-turn-helix domain-containing protein n=1 Tax=Vibrio tritonius TaxID=1435069 RepID=UPI00315D03FF